MEGLDLLEIGMINLYGNDIYGLEIVLNKIVNRQSINYNKEVKKKLIKNKTYIYEYYKILFYILKLDSDM